MSPKMINFGPELAVDLERIAADARERIEDGMLLGHVSSSKTRMSACAGAASRAWPSVTRRIRAWNQ